MTKETLTDRQISSFCHHTLFPYGTSVKDFVTWPKHQIDFLEFVFFLNVLDEHFLVSSELLIFFSYSELKC